MKLRACSRALRARADNLLFAHVEVESRDTGEDEVLELKPFGSRIHYPWFRLGHDVQHTRRLYPLMWPHVERWLVSHIRVIDFFSPDLSDCNRRGIKTWTKWLRVGCLIRSMKVSDSPASQHWTTSVTHGTGGSTVRGSCTVICCPNAFATSLEDILYSDQSCVVGHHLDLGPAPASLEMAVHLLNPDGGDMPVEDARSVLLILRTAFEFNSEIAPGTGFTVVGGAKYLRAVLGLDPAASPEAFAAALDAAVDVDTRSDSGVLWRHHGDLKATWRTLLRFLTPAEYAAEVGASQVALETQLDPSGPPAPYLK
jgi:hypothetical protein